MKNFHCDHCGNVVFFENVQCLSCSHPLGFVPSARDVSALEPSGEGLWRPLAAGAKEGLYRSCANHESSGCNWLIPATEGATQCVSCRLTRTVPDLSKGDNLQRLQKLERAKRRLIYTFLQLGVPMDGTGGDKDTSLRFDFLEDIEGQPAVMTGHLDGLITVNIAEADDVERERRRVNLREPIRTLLGHFRHEAAHYCWDRLVARSGWLEEFRARVGDERTDYAAAMKQYYDQGPKAGVATTFVTEYASAHPWEDWAETTAHYFHIEDTLETAAGFGVSLKPRHPSAAALTVDTAPAVKASADGSFDRLIDAWRPLTIALNALNRSMGLPDPYPFIVPEAVVEKLRFVHRVLNDEPPRI